MFRLDPVPSNVVGSPTGTWWWPTARATGGCTAGGGWVVNRTATGTARAFPGSLPSFAEVPNVAVYVVLDFIGSCETSSTSPPRLLADHSKRMPPGSGVRPNAPSNEVRSTRSVHTNQRSWGVLWPAAPSLGKLARWAGGAASIGKTAARGAGAGVPAGAITVARIRALAAAALGRGHD